MKALILVFSLACQSHGRRMHSQNEHRERVQLAGKDLQDNSRRLRVLSSLLWANSNPPRRPFTASASMGLSPPPRKTAFRRHTHAMVMNFNHTAPGNRETFEQTILTLPHLDGPEPLQVTTDDPFERNEADEKEKKEAAFKLNMGKAIDRLSEDIPQILRTEPHWDIFADDLKLDLELVDPVAFRMLGMGAPATKSQVKSLLKNRRAHGELLQFRKRFVEWDEIKARVRPSRDPGNGQQTIECRWSARLALKPFQIPQFPQWASVAVAAAVAAAAASYDTYPVGQLANAAEDLMHEAVSAEVAAAATTASAVAFLQDNFPNLGYNFATAATQDGENIIVVDAVSRFFLNSEGKLHRHVIDNVDFKLNQEPIKLADVDIFLKMAGIQKAYPGLATS